MPSPDQKKRPTDSNTTPSKAWRRRLMDDSEEMPNNAWQRLLQGVETPTETKTDSLVSTVISPFATTPVETPAETPFETKDNDGFALPTPRLPSSLRSTTAPVSTASLPNSTLQSTMPNSTQQPTSIISNNPLSTMMQSTLNSVVPSTKPLTPFTPSGDHIKDVPPMPLNFRKLLITAYNVFEEETMVKLEDKTCKTHMNSMLDGMKAKAVAKGDRLVQKLKELLDYIPKSYKGWTRSNMQKDFHKNFTQAVCLHLYRDDPDIDMGKIMKMNQFKNLKQQVLCLTPRRVSFLRTTPSQYIF